MSIPSSMWKKKVYMKTYLYSGLFRTYYFVQFWKGFKAINGIFNKSCF